MGWQELTPDPDAEIGESNAGLQAGAEEPLSSPGAGDWFIYPRGAHSVTIIADFSAGSGYVEATNASLSEIKAGTVPPRKIIKWAQGTVTIKTDDLARDIKALRQVNVSGTTYISLSSNN